VSHGAGTAGRLIVPVFPLPELTFFPHTMLPLHIFEARYRAMVIDAIARDKRIAVVGLKPGYEPSYAGKPPIQAVLGVGTIVRWERLATGRFNILVRGDARARVEHELPTDTLYRMVALRSLDETPPRSDMRDQIRRIRELCHRLLSVLGRSHDLLAPALEESQQPGAIADQVASAVLPDAALRQELLEMLDVEIRVDRVAGALEGIVRQVTRDRER
jgi:Lon protease-like protein